MTSPLAPADDGALALLGMVAYGELGAFARLAADSRSAPVLHQRLALARFAGQALTHLEQVSGRVVELGGDLEATMHPFAGVLTEFDRRTEPSTWWEQMLKAYVGYGVSDDFARVLARGTDPHTAEVVAGVMPGADHADFVIALLADAGADDATLAARLALWGRRLVGESLGAVQRVLADHPDVARLLASALPGEADPQQKLFTTLTAEHTRRMDRLQLAA